MKTQWCHECKHFDDGLMHTLGKTTPCNKGHKPRFYAPATVHQAHTGIYGWKRKCEDFERSEK